MKKLVLIIVILIIAIIGILIIQAQSMKEDSRPNENSTQQGENPSSVSSKPKEYDYKLYSTEDRNVYYKETGMDRPYYLVFDFDEADNVIGYYYYYKFSSNEVAGAYYNEHIDELIDPLTYLQIRCVDQYIIFEALPESYSGMTKADVEKLYPDYYKVEEMEQE